MKIAIIRTSSIGDVVLASSCLDVLYRNYEDLEVVWVGKQPSLQLMNDFYPKVKCIDIDKVSFSEIVDSLSAFQVVVDLQTNLRSLRICRELRKRHGISSVFCPKKGLMRSLMVLMSKSFGRHRILPERYTNPKKRQYIMMLETLKRGLDKVKGLDSIEVSCKSDDHLSGKPKLPISNLEDRFFSEALLLKGEWLAIAPGASYVTKRAPFEVVQAILTKLRDDLLENREGGFKLNLVFLGGPDDREICSKLATSIKWPNEVLDFSGKLSLTDCAIVLSRAINILTNDSALAHIAEAVDTPATVLFGPTCEGFGFSPWRSASKAFSIPLGCRPCSKHGKSICRFDDHACFKKLPIDVIASHLKNSYLENIAEEKKAGGCKDRGGN